MQLVKQERRTLQILRAPLAIMVAVIIIILLLLTFAQIYSAGQEKTLQTQKNLLSIARQHYQSSGVEKSTIAEYLPQYNALILQGFIGEEQRSAWCDLLYTQQKVHKLFNIKYTLSPQQDYQPLFTENVGGLVLHRSVMALNFDALHEADILLLIESLASKNLAPFMLRDCEITRVNEITRVSEITRLNEIIRPSKTDAINNELSANLNAKCELDWLTIHEPDITKEIDKP